MNEDHFLSWIFCWSCFWGLAIFFGVGYFVNWYDSWSSLAVIAWGVIIGIFSFVAGVQVHKLFGG